MTPRLAFCLLFLAVGASADTSLLLNLRHGQKETEARKILQNLPSRDIRFEKGSLARVDVRLNPPLELSMLDTVDVVEVEKPLEGDFDPGWRYLGRPSTGQVWTVSGEGKLIALEVTPAWKSSTPLRTWRKVLAEESPSSRPVKVKR